MVSPLILMVMERLIALMAVLQMYQKQKPELVVVEHRILIQMEIIFQIVMMNVRMILIKYHQVIVVVE